MAGWRFLSKVWTVWPFFTRRLRGRLTGVAVVAAAAAGGGVLWVHVAGASKGEELAAHPVTETFPAVHSVGTLAAESQQSSLRGTELRIERGSARGQRASIGGGDEVIAALPAGLTPVAVGSADGKTVVYSAWHQISDPRPEAIGQGLELGEPIGIPSVRAYDAATRKDQLIARGGLSPALSLDGRLAFLLGETEPVRQNVDYIGQIVVETLNDNSFELWTQEPAKYYPYAWIGSTLLAYEAHPDSEIGDLYAFTGPGQKRLLAPNAVVIAISPDGSSVLVNSGLGEWPTRLEIIRVRDGANEATLPLDAPGSPTDPHALFGGAWYGDKVVAGSDAGLVVLDVHDGIQIASLLESGPDLPDGISEPVLLDETHVLGWASLVSPTAPGDTEEPAHNNALVVCDLTDASCNVGPPSPPRIWTRWVTNPSQ